MVVGNHQCNAANLIESKFQLQLELGFAQFSPSLFYIFATFGSILASQLIWESGKVQLARWSHNVALFSWNHPPTHPPPAAHLFLTVPKTTGSLFWGGVSPPLLDTCSENMCGVPYSRYTLFCAVPPPLQFSFVPWTLWLCLGFWAKLRIWQVPACKMKRSSTCTLECGTPSWACLSYS